jgi:hypothetical protein
VPLGHFSTGKKELKQSASGALLRVGVRERIPPFGSTAPPGLFRTLAARGMGSGGLVVTWLNAKKAICLILTEIFVCAED